MSLCVAYLGHCYLIAKNIIFQVQCHKMKRRQLTIASSFQRQQLSEHQHSQDPDHQREQLHEQQHEEGEESGAEEVGEHQQEQGPQQQQQQQQQDQSLLNAVPSIENLLSTYEQWKLVLPENYDQLHNQTQRSWTAKFMPAWEKLYPWIETLKLNGTVVGIVCKVCRSKKATNDLLFESVLSKTQGKFIKTPFVRFGNFVEVAKVHEFGSSKIPDKCDVVEYRRKIHKGLVELPQTLHIRSASKLVTSISNINRHLVEKCGTNVEQQQRALDILFAQLHRTIKRRDSPFSSFKDTITFSISVLGCVDLKCFVRDGKGLSHDTIKI